MLLITVIMYCICSGLFSSVQLKSDYEKKKKIKLTATVKNWSLSVINSLSWPFLAHPGAEDRPLVVCHTGVVNISLRWRRQMMLYNLNPKAQQCREGWRQIWREGQSCIVTWLGAFHGCALCGFSPSNLVSFHRPNAH